MDGDTGRGHNTFLGDTDTPIMFFALVDEEVARCTNVLLPRGATRMNPMSSSPSSRVISAMALVCDGRRRSMSM